MGLKIFVLVVLMRSNGSAAAPTITFQEFSSLAQCRYVAQTVMKRPDARVSVDAFCVEK